MQEVDIAISKALHARDEFIKWDGPKRMKLLSRIADSLDEAAGALIEIAAKETNLPVVRLTGEVSRMTAQWRHMAEALSEGSYLGVRKDAADSTLQPPRPDLRKTTVPIGIVGVFGASNFPFAFGVGGCDTASAIAAGCPVIVKGHPGHIETSRRVFELIAQAASSFGAPEGVITLVESFEAGIEIVQQDDVSAVAFTGSTAGGRQLFDLAQSRRNPIPFYGELGGLNPIFVTEEAGALNGELIAKGFLESVSLGAGQFCTKPGYLITINGASIKEAITELISTVSTHAMLNERVRSMHQAGRDEFQNMNFVRLLAIGESESQVEPVAIYEVSASDLLKNDEDALREIFGPTAVLVDCKDSQEMIDVAKRFHGTLASGIHGEPEDSVLSAGLMEVLQRISGRILWNGWPTGVAVTWAMHHGGPYPATTNSLFTSVGADSIKRFRRPITFQNFPDSLLPSHLQGAS
jgi:NADP-dependent aldehyde dehydrogenase